MRGKQRAVNGNVQFSDKKKKSREMGLVPLCKRRIIWFVCMSCVKKGTRILKRQQKPHLQFPCSQTAWTDRIDLRLRHSIYLISHWVLNLSITRLSHLKVWVKLLERFVDYQEFPVSSFLLSATLLTYIGHRFVYSLPQSGYRTVLLAPQNDLMLSFYSHTFLSLPTSGIQWSFSVFPECLTIRISQ